MKPYRPLRGKYWNNGTIEHAEELPHNGGFIVWVNGRSYKIGYALASRILRLDRSQE